MALIQSAWATGANPVARPQSAFAVHTELFIIDIPAAGVAIADIIELGVLPPYSTIVDYALITTGSLGAGTVTVGFMSGETGETTNADGSARTVGAELFAASTVINGAVLRMSKTDALIAAPSDKDRSIGILLAGAAITAGAGKRIGLLVSFTQ